MKIEITEQGNTIEVTENVAMIIELAPFGLPAGISETVFTAKGQILSASGASTPTVIPAPVSNGETLIADSSQVTGWKTGIPTVELTGIPNTGWIPDTNTWSYSSADSPTGIISVNADLSDIVDKGMRVSYQQSQALSAYWTFSSSAADVGSFTMADVGTPTYTAGKFGNALTLDGSTDALSITDTATLKPTGSFTIGVWMKSSDAASNRVLFQSWNSATNIAGISLQYNANAIRFLVGKNTGTTPNADYNAWDGTTPVCDGNWHYIVLTCRNNIYQMYVDGVLEFSHYGFTPAYHATNYIRIGCYNPNGSNSLFFNGQMDDLFFINGYALDENTIRTQYRAAAAQGTGDITVTKMGIITNVGAYSGGATLLTVYHGTDFMLANATISNPKYSPVKAPLGFNLNPKKWRLYFMDSVLRTKSTIGAGTIYYADMGSRHLDIHIGDWYVGYTGEFYGTNNTTLTYVIISTALATVSTGYTDNELKHRAIGGAQTGAPYFGGTYNRSAMLISCNAKTTYYQIYSSDTAIPQLTSDGATTPHTIFAISAYL